MSTVKVAVEGCCHGELNKIYSYIRKLPSQSKPDLLIICGDFQSLRTPKDLASLAVPDKYKRLGDFASYYRGDEKAPVLTIFVGGNHEASNFLSEMPYGGWVAPRIYYMGLSSVVWFKGLRIGGLSGIYKEHNFYKPRYETVPYDSKMLRSVYHTRFAEYLKMSLIRDRNLNCFMSHDWPEGIVHQGDLKRLLKTKPFFKADIEKGELGSPASRELLKTLMPNYWFSAHLHVKFEATVNHDDAGNKRKLSDTEEPETKKVKNDDEIDLGLDDAETGNTDEIALDMSDDEQTNSNEIDLDLDDEEGTGQSTPKAKGFSQTNFLALDKVLPGRQFIEIIDIPVTNEHKSVNAGEQLFYDEEYVKILKWFQAFQKSQSFERLKLETVTPQLIEQLGKDVDMIKIADDTDFKVPRNFKAEKKNGFVQTEEFKKTFGL